MTLGLARSHDEAVSIFEREEQTRIRAAIARVAIFRELPADAIDDLAAHVTQRRALGGAPVVSQSEPGDALYILMSGRAKVVMVGENGREVTLSVLRPHDVFGEITLFEGGRRTASVIALEPVTALAIGREDLVRHLADHPRTALNLLGELARRLRRADETIAELALCDVEDRLIRRLVHLAKEDQTDLEGGMLIRRRPTQQDLANMVGSCRETISRTYNQLARKGLIEPRGRALLVTRRLFDLVSAPAQAA